MIVLKITQQLLTFVGLQFKDTNPVWYKWYRVICCVMLVTLLQPMISHLMGILDDVIQATDVCIQISAESTTSVKAFVFLVNWQKSKWLLDTMQSDFNKNEVANRTARFVKADRECEFVTKWNNWMLLIAGVTFTLGPLAILLINAVRGTIVPEMWIHPFKADFLFDYTSSPGYEFAYLLNIVYNIYVASFYGAIDTFYVGLCLYSMAYLNDLMDLINEMDMELFRHRKFPILNQSTHDNSLTNRISVMVKYHYKVLEFTENTSSLMTGILFAQFCGSLFTISTIAFQIILSNDGTVLIYVGPLVAVLVELFMYCYYGNMLSVKGLEVADAIYQCNWYDFPIGHQRFVQMVMVRMQRPILMTGYGLVIGDLPTFAVVLKSVTSVIALFQSIEE